MNIPHKITKTNYIPQEKSQSYQKTASKYFKQYQRLKKDYEPANTVSNTKSKSIKGKNFRDEVIKWFFSLDLMTKIIVSSIENKWITCILHQLYVSQKNEPRLRFKIKEYDFFNFSNQNSANDYVPSLLKVTMNENAYNSLNFLPQDYLNYYHYFSKEDGYYNNYVSITQMNELDKNFLSEIFFYRSEEVLSEIFTGKSQNSNMNKYSNYFTLSEKILQDETLFKSYFYKLSNNLAFSYLIDSSYDQTSKNYNICLPNWVNNREYYSLAEIFAAIFEQIISVRFVLYKQNQNEFLNHKTHYEFVNEEREDLLKFMNKNLPLNEVHSRLNIDEIVEELYSDKIIEDFIVCRFHKGEKESFAVANYYKWDREILFDKIRFSIKDLKSKTENFLRNFRNQKEFLNFLTFMPLDKIFTFDDFLFRKFYEALLNLRSKLTAMDLMKELEFEEGNEIREKIGERKKSESVSNAYNPNQTKNALIGNFSSNGGKVNKKKKKKRGSNAANSNLNAKSENVENTDACHVYKNEENIENNSNKASFNIKNCINRMIIPSLDSDHIILEIRNDHDKVDDMYTNDIEKNLNSNPDLKNKIDSNNFSDENNKKEISINQSNKENDKSKVKNIKNIENKTTCNKSSEEPKEMTKIDEITYSTYNPNEKQYAFKFIKRKKNIDNQIDKSENKTKSEKPTEIHTTNTHIDNLTQVNSSNTINDKIKFTSGEFMGSMMLIKQTSENQFEKKENEHASIDEFLIKIVKEVLDEIITKICFINESKEKTSENLNLLHNLKNLDSLPKKSISPSISEKVDQNDIDTAYSSDGNKSESTENKSINTLKGKNKKRQKENKFFLYNIKESNLTGYKHKKDGNGNNFKVVMNENENPKMSLPTGGKETQKILMQIIDQHFENMKEKAENSNFNPNSEFHQNEKPLKDEGSYFSFNNQKNKSVFTNNSILNKNKIFKNEERENNLISLVTVDSCSIENDNFEISKNDLISKNSENMVINEDKNIFTYNGSQADLPNNKHFTHYSPKTHKLNKNNFYNTLNSPKTLNSNYNPNKESFNSNYNSAKVSVLNPILDISNNNNFHNVTHNKNHNNSSYRHYKYFMEKPTKSNMIDTNIPMINPISSVNSIFYHPIPSFNNPHFYNSFINPIKPIKPLKSYPFSHFMSNDYLLHYNQHQNHLSFDLFQLKIQKDIYEFSETVDKNLIQLKPIKNFTISYLENIIKQFFELNFNSFNIEVELYGSFASNLAIESSDIDITIKLTNKIGNDNEIYTENCNTTTDIVSVMSSLVENLKTLGIFEIIYPIYTATVPVVKLVIDPTSILDENTEKLFTEFKQCEAYKSYIFNKDDLDKIRIDLTFSNVNCLKPAYIRQNQSLIDNKNITKLHLDYIKESLLVFPELKPLIQILKRFLQMNKLHCSFNGGLSSFSLFLLLLAHVKTNRLNFTIGIGNNPGNLGKLFTDFFLFYGNLFEFNYTVIDVNMDNPFILCSQQLDAIPTILDPITYLNAGKSSYRTIDIKYIFSSAFEKINEMKILFEKKQGIIHENFVNVLLRTEIESNL